MADIKQPRRRRRLTVKRRWRVLMRGPFSSWPNSKGELSQWSDQLSLMAAVAGNDTMCALLDNPR